MKKNNLLQKLTELRDNAYKEMTAVIESIKENMPSDPSEKEDETFCKVQAIIVEHLDVFDYQVTPTAKLVEDLHADSLDEVELVMAFEEAFGIDIPDVYVKGVSTVGDCVEKIKNSVQNKENFKSEDYILKAVRRLVITWANVEYSDTTWNHRYLNTFPNHSSYAELRRSINNEFGIFLRVEGVDTINALTQRIYLKFNNEARK